ncbi:hypothetical protein PB1_05330 [Bacillus methanolicus PB1]|uniref:Uncharacterized protein n=1 Tax=Bacillus methanolicus PB1 TaxID=997296 RepID=I3E753_BACMT|nr:hypothetical protein PB1_00770 [Bacillus methanolicus PB1]EIJ82324.1 hypothetical protein PB1_05330 [Bacillus methanolicus PB1]
MEDEGTITLSDNPTMDELMKKYEQAMKLLGEKELEVAMLKNLLKKTSPDRRTFRGSKTLGCGRFSNKTSNESSGGVTVVVLLSSNCRKGRQKAR